MNILLYIPFGKNAGGAYQYACALLEILKADQENKYFIYHKSNDDFINNFCKENNQFELVEQTNANKRAPNLMSKLLSVLVHKGKQHQGQRLTYFNWIKERYHIDIVHSVYQNIPRWDIDVPIVSTLHDVQELLFPQYFSPEKRAERAINRLNSVSKSSCIVVSYQHVKNDIIKFFNIAPERVKVILLSMSSLSILNHRPSKTIVGKAIHNYRDFILYPASTWEHKNHINLIKSLCHIKKKYNTRINLVCTGDKKGFYEKIKEQVNQLDIQDQVNFTGIIDESDLYCLYKTCRAVVIPTQYEAGSFPLMESMLLGVPVVCSNVTSLPETIGDKKFTFDPNSIEEISDSIYSIWSDKQFRDKNVENSEEKKKLILETEALESFISLYSNLLEAHCVAPQ
ncbi:MAG: glycosyltransferase family 1 protein [Cyclobacteriaceae bacterium]